MKLSIPVKLFLFDSSNEIFLSAFENSLTEGELTTVKNMSRDMAIHFIRDRIGSFNYVKILVVERLVELGLIDPEQAEKQILDLKKS